MKNSKRLMVASISAALVGLSACGGGGSGGGSTTSATSPTQAAAINTGNYVQVAQSAVTAVLVGGTSEFLIGVEQSQPRLTQLLTGVQMRLVKRRSVAGSFVTGVQVSEVETCPNGGTMRVSGNVTNLNYPSAGDSLRATFTACREGSTTLDGIFDLVIGSVTGNPASSNIYSFSANTTFTGFRLVSTTGFDFTVNGSATLSLNSRSATDTTVTSTLNFTAAGTQGTAALSYQYKNLQITVDDRSTGSTLSVAGTVQTPAGTGPDLMITTLRPLFTPAGRLYPVEGQIRVDGSGGGRVSLTARSDGQTVAIELDADSNGTVDATTTKTWVELGL